MPPSASSKRAFPATLGVLGWAAALLLPLATVASAADAPVPVTEARVIARLPHDPTAFTEGFFVRDGAFWESTGEIGHSSIREVDPATGAVKREVQVPPPYFGEGIASVGDEIVSLTWQHHVGFRWRAKDLKQVGRFSYAGEGWSLASDGKMLVMSDGTSTLRRLDPKTLAVTGTIAVTLRGQPVEALNELEIVDGEILANVWHTASIVRIDPASGRVIGVIDLSALVREVDRADPEGVANGIAWDAAHRKLYVTGKLWPTVFEIAPPQG